MDTREHVVFAAELGEPLEPGLRLRDLVGERSEGPILPVAELEAAGAVVCCGGEDRLGMRAVGVGEPRADHRNCDARGVRGLPRSGQQSERAPQAAPGAFSAAWTAVASGPVNKRRPRSPRRRPWC